MNSELLKIKGKELIKELEPCLGFYRDRVLALKKDLDVPGLEQLFLEEVLRVLCYLDSKEKLSHLVLEASSDLLNSIFPTVRWNKESLVLNMEEYKKRNPGNAKEFDTEIFTLPRILEIVREYDEYHLSNKFDKASLFLTQIFQIIINADGIIQTHEEKFLMQYNSVINRKKFSPLMDDQQFANQLSRIYDDFFGYSEKIKTESNHESKEKNSGDHQNTKNDTLSKTKTAQEQTGNIVREEKIEKLEDVLNELNSLIGLQAVKAEIENLTNVIKVEKIRKDKGLAVPDKSLHLVFTGNPGTGKTTVARLLARIYRAMGVLAKGHLIETDRSGLVAGFVGQTANKTLEVAKSALDGVLFIDEAYALAEGGDNDFGKEAINTLLKFMEDNRSRIIVIVAGYTGNMEEFIAKNPGLKSRFNKYIHFDDYSPEDLMKIFEKICKSMKLEVSEKGKEKLLSIFQREYEKRDEKFGNGRFARNLFEKAYLKQANRLVKLDNLTDEVLCTLTEEDID